MSPHQRVSSDLPCRVDVPPPRGMFNEWAWQRSYRFGPASGSVVLSPHLLTEWMGAQDEDPGSGGIALVLPGLPGQA